MCREPCPRSHRINPVSPQYALVSCGVCCRNSHCCWSTRCNSQSAKQYRGSSPVWSPTRLCARSPSKSLCPMGRIRTAASGFFTCSRCRDITTPASPRSSSPFSAALIGRCPHGDDTSTPAISPSSSGRLADRMFSITLKSHIGVSNDFVPNRTVRFHVRPCSNLSRSFR